MMSPKYQHCVETNALPLADAWWLLERAFLQLIALADTQRAYRINRILTNIDSERQRWLRTVDSPIS